MRNDLPKTPYVGFARPARIGGLLRLGPGPLSVAWSNPSRSIYATGLGVVAEGGGDISWLSSPPAHSPPGPWFGGWAFDAQRCWPGFDEERWVLPRVLAWWDGAQSWLASFDVAGTSVHVLEERLDSVGEVEPFTQPLTAREVSRGRERWADKVEKALVAIADGRFEKVVLARVIELEGQGDFAERAVLKALEARHPQCWSFLVRGREGNAFVGASPETLCEIHGDVLSSDALAGTSAAGQGVLLLSNDKERREHQSVVDGIRESLGPWVDELFSLPTPIIKVLSNVEHLFTPVRARLKAGVNAVDVAHALHPTPAVAGRPRSEALAWLREHEGFARGWYAGAVGAMGPSSLTLAVALRSALLSGARAKIFVGAGIVAGSTPEGEWLETQRKAQAMLPALGVSSHD